jgi:hypothetical protein
VTARTPDDDRYLAQLQQERQQAAEAIERITGGRAKRELVDNILAKARNQALDRGTTVAHEIERTVQQREKARQSRQRRRKEHLRKHSPEFIKIEGKLKQAMRSCTQILDESEGIEFTGDYREILMDTLGKLRARLDQIAQELQP